MFDSIKEIFGLKQKEPKVRDGKLNVYPCDYHLHNALHFMLKDKPNIGYTEICYAIMKSGGALNEEENKRFIELQNK